MAKNNENSIYARRLSIVQSFSAADNYTVSLTLASQHGSIASLLDIPIIKKNSGLTNDAVGCGRYMIQEDDDILYLVPFGSYYGGTGENIAGENVALGYILLTEITDNDVLEYGVMSGNVDIITVNMLPKNGVHIYADADKLPVNTSDLIYVGFNTKYGAAANQNLRKALELLIDTKALRTDAFGGHVKQAWGIYPQCLYADTAAAPETAPDITGAKSLITSAGYFYSSSGMFKTVAVRTLSSG
jgi:hypothetical protein